MASRKGWNKNAKKTIAIVSALLIVVGLIVMGDGLGKYFGQPPKHTAGKGQSLAGGIMIIVGIVALGVLFAQEKYYQKLNAKLYGPPVRYTPPPLKI